MMWKVWLQVVGEPIVMRKTIVMRKDSGNTMMKVHYAHVKSLIQRDVMSTVISRGQTTIRVLDSIFIAVHWCLIRNQVN